MKTALLMIDVQRNMFDPARPVADARALHERLEALLERARFSGAPVFHVRNTGVEGDPDIPGTPGWELELTPAEGETVLDKTTCDTFASTDLNERLEELGVRRVVIAGLQSDFCIRETTGGALGNGYAVTLVSDGHSTYDSKSRNASELTGDVNVEMARRDALLLPAAEVHFS